MARTGYDFQSLTQENRDWKEARAMSKEIIQFDQAMFETKLDAMVRDKVEQIINAMLDEEADLIANAARYERSDGRKAYRAGHYARRFTVKAGRLGLKVPKLKGALFESQAQGRPVRVGGDRTLPAAGAERRGVVDRHVSGRRQHAPRGRHQSAAVGRADALADALRQAQEGVRPDRRMAQPAAWGRVPVRVHGRCAATGAHGAGRSRT